MRYLLFIFTAALCLAQAPKGATAGYRLKFSNMENGDYLFSRGMTGAWDLSGVGAAQTVDSLVGTQTLTVGNIDSDTTADPTAMTGWMDFPGSGQRLKIPDSVASSPTSTMTLTTVVKVDIQDNRIMWSKWGSGAARSYIFYFGQDSGNDKATCGIVQSDGSTSANHSPTDLTYTAGTWSVWTCVANGSNIQVFKNGRPSNNAPLAYNGTINDSTTTLAIGTLTESDSTYSLDGQIAYLSISKTAYTNAQVWKYYKVLRTRMANQGITLP